MTGPLLSDDGKWLWNGEKWLPAIPNLSLNQNILIDEKPILNYPYAYGDIGISKSIKDLNPSMIGTKYPVQVINNNIEDSPSDKSEERINPFLLYGRKPWEDEEHLESHQELAEEIAIEQNNKNQQLAENLFQLIQSFDKKQIMILENIIENVKFNKSESDKKSVSKKRIKNNYKISKLSIIMLTGIFSVVFIIGPVWSLSLIEQIISVSLISSSALTINLCYEKDLFNKYYNKFTSVINDLDFKEKPIKPVLLALFTSILLINIIVFSMNSDSIPFSNNNETDYSLQDLDGDGLSNADEWSLGTDINKSDTDNDGLSDLAETKLGTNPLLFDSDFDGFSDLIDLYPLQDWKATITYSGTEIEFNEICDGIGTRSMTWRLRIEVPDSEVIEEYSYGLAGSSGVFELDLPDDKSIIDIKLYYHGWYSNCIGSNEQQLFFGFATTHTTSDPGLSRTGYEITLTPEFNDELYSRGTRDGSDYTESGWLASATIKIQSNLN